MAGALATVAYLPTTVPLIWQTIRHEENTGKNEASVVAFAVHSAVKNGLPVVEGLRAPADVTSVNIRQGEGPFTSVHGALLPELVMAEACANEEAVVVPYEQRKLWAVSCIEKGDLAVIAAVVLDPASPAQRVLLLVLSLGLSVGIITALGILRLLRPLSEISGALARVGAGVRGVRMSKTGLAELDDLVDRLNAAARSVEDREDTIVGRIQVVQEMARMVAHEIRNPLQSLELLTSLIASEEEADEREEIAKSIRSEVQTLEQVVHRLLQESAARGALRLRVTTQPVAPLVEQVITLRTPQANNRSVRLTSGPISWAPAPFDSPLLKRSIENLVLNALQAVPPLTGLVEVSVIEEEEHMLIAVDDNGPGVAEALGDAVFEPKVSSKEGGMGLGLALVKGVVEAHHGDIRHGRSALGGARFEARIPLKNELRFDNADPNHLA